jgi:hypothetical protein
MVKRAGVLLEPRRFPCDLLLLVGVHEGLDTSEVLKERVKNAAQ